MRSISFRLLDFLQATGFRPPFSHSWTSRKCVGLLDLSLNFRLLLMWLALFVAKKAARTARHQQDANFIYKDTKRPIPEPVASLLITSQAQVTEVDQENRAVYDLECTFDCSILVMWEHIRSLSSTQPKPRCTWTMSAMAAPMSNLANPSPSVLG